MATATEERVILVDADDQPVGTAEKLRAHREGLLHRAFSVFIFDPRGRLLLQRRHHEKYHSGSLWSNTCCSHPRPGETVLKAAARRLREEMGLTCELEPVFETIYRVRLDELWEHELDHVLLGYWEGPPSPDPQEVSEWRWVPLEELSADIERRPERYTYWLRLLFRRVRDEADRRRMTAGRRP